MKKLLVLFGIFFMSLDVNAETVSGVSYPFSLTTVEMSANSVFNFMISARGTFYVDCGSDGTLSGTGASGGTITKNDTTEYTYTCTYSTGGVKTIQFGGLATRYNVASSYPAIRFFSGEINYGTNGINSTGTEIYIAGINGSLGAIFPTIDETTTLQPSFYRVFGGLTNVSGEIPPNLFSGVYGKMRHMMFYCAFSGSAFTGNIPSGLYSQFTQLYEWAFGYAFSGCNRLTGTIPSDLFENIYIGNLSASYALYNTFRGCSGLSGYIPPTTFARLISDGSNYATNMKYYMFDNTGILTSCPNGTSQVITGYEQYWNGRVSCEPNTLNVNWYNENTQLSVGSESQSCVYGDYITVPTVSATKPGYHFGGWKVKQ